uniref:BD-FAE-like domain-containing protein n=1 Tax=Timspurckia oligopyrenoides TaxID=708627 RepID=A0A7S0ZBZ1_9RHOD|mmetsp:Transcript_11840/g.21415  ORF Transcript_11840/g.21415 Transcript_11840/m.21415 type:complete len:412 (+) Transcript_11840:289-1524(+)
MSSLFSQVWNTFVYLETWKLRFKFVLFFSYLIYEAHLFNIIHIPLAIRMLWRYYFSPFICRNIPYSCHEDSSSRRVLDVYSSTSDDDERCLVKKPVVLFIHGGAWGHGEKWQYSLLAQFLMLHGCVCVIATYRIYPLGDVSSQIVDVYESIVWTKENIEQYGGDCKKILVFGHSAGAHLAMMALLSAGLHVFTKHLDVEGRTESALVAAFVASCGVYDIAQHYMYETWRGVAELSTMMKAMNGIEYFEMYSPLHVLREMQLNQEIIPKHWFELATVDQTLNSINSPLEGDRIAAQCDPSLMKFRNESELKQRKFFPPVFIMSSGADSTVPFQGNLEFARELIRNGLPCRVLLYDGVNHSDFVMDYMRQSDRDHRHKFVQSSYNQSLDNHPTQCAEVHPSHIRDFLRIVHSL